MMNGAWRTNVARTLSDDARDTAVRALRSAADALEENPSLQLEAVIVLKAPDVQPVDGRRLRYRALYRRVLKAPDVQPVDGMDKPAREDRTTVWLATDPFALRDIWVTEPGN